MRWQCQNRLFTNDFSTMKSGMEGAHNLQGLELKRQKFQNGMVAIGNTDSSIGSIAIRGSIEAGAICDENGKFGTAELVTRLLTRGTSKYNAGKISEMVEELGATLDFSNHDETVVFAARCHSRTLKEILNVISACITDPLFPQEELDRAQDEIIAQIKADDDDTRSVAYRELAGLIYGKDAPYGKNSMGKTEDLKKITRQDIKSFYEANYSSSKLIFALTGNFEHDFVTSELEKLLTSWTGGSGKISYKPSATNPGTRTVQMNHKSQADIAIGAKAVPRTSPSYYALNIGNLILGRMGLYGRLGKNVREEKGLAYYSFSSLQAKTYSGHIAAMAGVNPKNLENAIEGILEEISRISSEEISLEELEKAKKNSLGSLSISLDSSSERVSVIHDIEYYALGLDYLDRYEFILGSVTQKQILDEFKLRLRKENLSLAIAGPIPEEVTYNKGALG